MENLSVSFVNRAFVISKLRVHGRTGTPCAKNLLGEATEVTGNFNLQHRRLTGLKLIGLQIQTPAFSQACLIRPGEKADFKLTDITMPEGVSIVLESAQIPIPEFGLITTSTKISLTDSSPGVLSIQSDRLLAGNARLQIEAKGVKADFLRTDGTYVLGAANLTLFLRVKELARISRLRTKKLTVLGGDAEIRSVAAARGGRWKIDSTVSLLKLKVKGEPLFSMPLGILKLSPENMWPMAEDSPGKLDFSFKTEAYPHQLFKAIAADIRHALGVKVRANLKKKMPGLPF